MRKTTFLSASFAAMLAVALPSVSARAQLYVASNGTGTACTLAAPCRTFQAAHDAALAGREIKCIDSGDYAEVIITKSITIDCTATSGAIIASGHAVSVSTPGLVVTLRGLDLQGVGLGPTAVDFAANGELHVENCRVAGWQDGGLGKGIAFHPGAGTSALFVIDSIVDNNGLSTSGGGILVEPTGSASVNVVIQGTQFTENTQGIVIDGSSSSGRTVAKINDSLVAGSSMNGITVNQAGTLINRASVEGNLGNGILAGPGAVIHLGSSTVATNSMAGLAYNGGQIFSYQNNQTKGNGVDTAPSGVLTLN